MSLPSNADSSKEVRARVREALHSGDIKTGALLLLPPRLQQVSCERCLCSYISKYHASAVQLYIAASAMRVLCSYILQQVSCERCAAISAVNSFDPSLLEESRELLLRLQVRCALIPQPARGFLQRCPLTRT